jgi:hypothetical protein
MSKQQSVCRLILDFREILTNQVFSAIQQELTDNKMNKSDQKSVLENVRATVDKSFNTIVDNVIKVID